MGNQRLLADAVTQTELCGRVPPSEDQLANKVARKVDRRTEQVISGPVSSDAPAPRGQTVAPAKGKADFPKSATEIAAYHAFRRVCDDIFQELKRLDGFLHQGEVTVEGLEVVVEIEELLERLYDCRWGQGESLKRLVVAIQSQVKNGQWTERHVGFLKDVIRFIRVRYLIDDASVDTCYEFMKARGLDPFRGSLCQPQVVKKYRIEEVKDQ